jgi:hypothetical protein
MTFASFCLLKQDERAAPAAIASQATAAPTTILPAGKDGVTTVVCFFWRRTEGETHSGRHLDRRRVR